jgi:kelch-like protein 1/4/5
VANMCKRRGGVGVGVINGFLYAVGGHDAPAVSNPQQSRCCLGTK